MVSIYNDINKTEEETPLFGEKKDKTVSGFPVSKESTITKKDIEEGEATHLKSPSLSLGPQAVPTKIREIRDTNGNLVQTQEENLTHYVTTPPRKFVNEVRELDGKKKSETSN